MNKLLCATKMNIYPRKFTIDEIDDGNIINFDWPAPGFSTWGIWFISKFISSKTGAKKTNSVQSPFESQIVLSLDGMQISIYQEDNGHIDVMSLTQDTNNQFQNIISLFNESKLFKNSST